jgi:hypothetical protein
MAGREDLCADPLALPSADVGKRIGLQNVRRVSQGRIGKIDGPPSSTGEMRSMQLNKSSWVALGTVAGGGLALYYMFNYIEDLQFDALGASFFPKVAAIGLVSFGAILFVTEVWGKGVAKKDVGYNFKESMKILCYLMSLFLYVFFLPMVGFLISTTLLMFIIFMVLNDHWRPINICGALIFSIICTGFLWYIFTRQFGLILP